MPLLFMGPLISIPLYSAFLGAIAEKSILHLQSDPDIFFFWISFTAHILLFRVDFGYVHELWVLLIRENDHGLVKKGGFLLQRLEQTV